MDRLDAIWLFVRVVEKGSFSAAAREAGIGQSAASKQIAGLEAHLGALLLVRTSRRLRVTETGQNFYESALRLLDDYAALEGQARLGQASTSGLLRISVAPGFGRLYIVPNLPEFFGRFPDIRVEMAASERQVDLIEDGIDLAIRHGSLVDSTMTARKIATSPFVTVATPEYFEKNGVPSEPAGLARHACLAFTGGGEIRPWMFRGQEGASAIHHPRASFCSNDGEQLKAAALSHLGIAHLPAWIVTSELRAGTLLAILQKQQTEANDISAVYLSRRGPTAKLRLFVDFLTTSLARDLRLGV